MSKEKQISIIMGSVSDWDVMKHCADTLKKFNLSMDAKVLSAHRTPGALMEYMDEAEKNGVQVYIAAAGLAAHLAGVIASHTTRPVLGVPMNAGSLGGLDALLSMVQMPPGIPVATLGVGKPGAINAALYAIHILSLQNEDLAAKLAKYRKEQADKVLNTTLEI